MSEDKEKDNNIADILKKVVNTGISAAFMTEDAVKTALKDLPLPKEIINGLLANAKNTKDEFIESVKTELSTYLNKIDVSKEIDRLAENFDIEVNAKIKLTPKKKKATKKNKSDSDE